MYTLNIYLNWSPIQERSDWLATWSKEGIKPLFFVEWGPPHISNWADYRGPGFIWNCRALIQLWDAEFAAAEQGQEAYLIDETSRRNLLEQQRRYREGVPYQWPVLLRSTGFQFQEKNYLDVQSVFVNDNWRSHRAHGISAMLLWDQDGQFLPTPNEKIIDYSEKYNNINAPGIVPDQIQPSLVLLYGKSVDNYLYAPEGTPRKLTSLGRSMFRWNQPFCAFIGGRANDFTEKRHNYFPGERVSRTLVMINDTRQTGDVVADITFPGTEFRRKFTTEIEPGGRKDFSFDLQLPDGIKPGRYQLEMTCTMTLPKNTNESNQPYLKQEDRFTIDIVAKPVTSQTPTVYLFDPAGKTADLFRDAKISFTQIGQEELLAGTKHFPADATVVIGRDGLNDLSLTIPELSKMVKSGLKLMVMEQQPKVLNERFGFRIQVLGLRKVFAVDRTHSLFAGKNMRELSDWAGESTMTPPYVDGATSADPRWIWNGFENTRVWRCRNRGNVASVLIEKPERGGFEPLLTGGFDLQYTPLLELRDGKGIVLFSQLDFSGRTENDPAAISLLHDMISYLASGPKPDEERFRTSPRHLVYSGNQEILEVLESLGFKPEKFTANETLEKNTLLVLGPDFDRQIAPAELRSRGVNIFAIGLNAAESERVTGRRFANVCRLPDHSALDVGRGALRGISQADLYWRGEIPFAAPVEPRNAVEKSGALFIGSSASGEGQVLLLQVSPKWFEVNNPVYFRKTARRSWYLVGQLLSNLGAPAVSGVPALLEKSGIITTIELDSGWVGKSDPDETGRKNGWYEDNFNTGDWKAIKVPGMFDQQFPDVKKIGLFWYCRKFMLPKNFAGEELTLSLGIVDDESWVWLNGKFLGELTGKTHPEIYWHTPRNYTLSPDMLRYGQENSLVVLVRNLRDSGGMIGVPRLWAPARFLQSYYVQAPVASDDPYRYYRW